MGDGSSLEVWVLFPPWSNSKSSLHSARSAVHKQCCASLKLHTSRSIWRLTSSSYWSSGPWRLAYVWLCLRFLDSGWLAFYTLQSVAAEVPVLNVILGVGLRLRPFSLYSCWIVWCIDPIGRPVHLWLHRRGEQSPILWYIPHCWDALIIPCTLLDIWVTLSHFNLMNWLEADSPRDLLSSHAPVG